jgi:phage terminase large subunit GpA-like protein
MATLFRQEAKTTPDAWGAKNRVYPPHTDYPGPRNPFLTPYTVPFGRAIAEREHRQVVMIMAAQMGKTDTFLDIIGRQFDQDPKPTIYVGPNKQFLNEQFEPRIMGLLDEAPKLRGKVMRGKRMTKTRKVIAGVPLRLAHAGSPTALKSDPASLALTDEVDDLMANVKGQGDPIELINNRGWTYGDFVHAMVSTPSDGPSEMKRDEQSGLHFWVEQDGHVLGSKVWRLWQQGTRHHWAWPCVHCDEFFVPHFALLHWPEKSTPARAKKEAYVECPNCGGVIEEQHKAAMNERGLYVAPGQKVVKGEVVGALAANSTISFWVSGLCSPFVSFGQRAEAWLLAVASGDEETKRGVINGGFGELYAPGGGDVPEWQEVQNLIIHSNARNRVPKQTIFLTMGVDVQKTRLVYVTRAWGPRQESWLVDHGMIWGETDQDQVWLDLAELIDTDVDGFRPRRVFIDAGFRPGKREIIPEHKVYEFTRRHQRNCYATKGYDQRSQPVSVNKIEVMPRGNKPKYGLDLVRLDTDFLKSWVHQRVRWPKDAAGGWHLHSEVEEDYCRQIVSEARMRKPSGVGVIWTPVYRENHFLDCEALAYGAAYMLGIQRRTSAPPASAGVAAAQQTSAHSVARNALASLNQL